MASASTRPDFHEWRPHPWHGLEAGRQLPLSVNAYIEITPFDLIKYEVDKVSGYVKVDRPQRTSSQPPSLYGFVPRTYCGNKVAALCPGAERGDGDPLDICVLSERPITRAETRISDLSIGRSLRTQMSSGSPSPRSAPGARRATFSAQYVWGMKP